MLLDLAGLRASASVEKSNPGNNMLKKINRVLRLVGLNLVRAKRKKAVKQSYYIVPPLGPTGVGEEKPDSDNKTTGASS